jgi:poly(A) polymerase
MKRIDELLCQGRGDYWYWGKTALDRYYKNKPSLLNIATTASLSELAQNFENLSYPGLEESDALLETKGVSLLFTLVDSQSKIPSFKISPLNLLFSLKENKYIDRKEEYVFLREKQLQGEPTTRRDWEHLLRQTAWESEDKPVHENLDLSSPLPESLLRESDRFFLEDVLTGSNAHATLNLLLKKGWINAHLPELADLTGIEQNKEFHPEGNVWEHTLETLKYRKERPINLSLALLFHDLGKARAEEVGGNRFHGHAQIGAYEVNKNNGGLGFPPHDQSRRKLSSFPSYDARRH